MIAKEVELWTIAEAAEARCVSEHTIRRWARDGIAGVKLRLQLKTNVMERFVDPADLTEFFRQVSKRKGLTP